MKQDDTIPEIKLRELATDDPLDAESGEAMADEVNADGLHGTGMRTYNDHMEAGEWVTVTNDMALFEVVGDFTGSQMAVVDVDAPVGLVDHVGEGRINAPFAARTIVVEGGSPFTSLLEGALPDGMTYNEATGVLEGTPLVSGSFQFKITASDSINPDVSKNYTLRVASAVAALPPASLVDTVAEPVAGGTTSGDGSFAPASNVTVTATAEPGYRFVNWTDNGAVVGTTATLAFNMRDVNRSLTAHFVVADVPTDILVAPETAPGVAFSMEWSLLPEGWVLQESPDMTPTSWIDSVRPDSPQNGLHHVEIPTPAPEKLFFRLKKP